MIDLHTHVLPRVDDGPDSLEEALETVCALASGGTQVIVATPHNMPGIFEAGVEQIKFAAEALRDVLATTEVPVRLLVGQEITFRPGLLEKLERGELLTINETGYFLMEFPPYFVPPGVREFIFEARLQGLTPILAHPERNEVLARDPGLLSGFVEGGMLTQLTASSVFGRMGSNAGNAARMMLRDGLAHTIATDSHSFRFGPGDLQAALHAATEIVGEEAALRLVQTNAAAIIEGVPLAL